MYYAILEKHINGIYTIATMFESNFYVKDTFLYIQSFLNNIIRNILVLLSYKLILYTGTYILHLPYKGYYKILFIES